MSSNGVILQHRAELIAYLFVDRSNNLLIDNHIKKSLSLTTGDCNWENNRNLLRSGVNVWTDCGRLPYLPLRFLYKFLILLSSLPAIGLCSDDCHFTCFLAGYRSLVNSSRILQLIVTIRVHCEFDPPKSATSSIHLAQLPHLTRSQSLHPLLGRLETRR